MTITTPEPGVVGFRCDGLSETELRGAIAQMRPTSCVHVFCVGPHDVDRQCISQL